MNNLISNIFKMGRMYGRGKGLAKSSIPYKKKPPRWLSVNPAEVLREIEVLAKKGIVCF